MEIKLSDGRESLWQWDTGRYLEVTGTTATEIHFSRDGARSSHTVQIEGGKAKIPDHMLIRDSKLAAYIVEDDDTGEKTVFKQTFDIRRRPKPDDYIYTEQEIKRWEQLEQRIDALEKEGATADHTKLTNRDAADQHPIWAITGLSDVLNNNSATVSIAMGTASAAVTAAGKAQTTADNAQTAANKAQSTADTANATVEELDNRITAAEEELTQKQPKGEYLTSETDPTVPTWAKQPQKPTYTATEVGALPRDTTIPSKLSELENDTQYAKTSELPQIDATLQQSGQAADAAETGKRIESISLDDNTINGKPWSSKHIVDMLCPPLEESGNPVVCYPVAGCPLGVKASWEPVQEGSGTPSPENIRPIKGRDSVTITRQEYNQVITLTLPETVYGGEVDAVSSEGRETWKYVILNGTESWGTWGINANNPAVTGFYTYDITDYDIINAKGICSHLAPSRADAWGGANAGLGFATTGEARYLIYCMPTSLLPDISAGHEVASLKAYLAAQYAAGTPVQIAYTLATPAPFTATGAQPIPALAGANTVLTDADSVTVTGRADPIKRIEDLEDAAVPQWYQVADITLTEPVQRVSIDKDAEGNLIADYAPIIEIIRVEYAADSTQASRNGAPWIYPFPTTDANNGRFVRNIDNWKNLTRTESYLYTGKGKCIWGQSGGTTAIGEKETSTITGALVMLNNAVSDTEPYDHLSVGTNVKVLVYGVKP